MIWDAHELASSRRTSGVDQIIFDGGGNQVASFPSEKNAGGCALPDGAAYVLRRYWTGSRKPQHELLALPDLASVAEVTGDTSISDIMEMDIPEGIRTYLIDDVWQ